MKKMPVLLSHKTAHTTVLFLGVLIYFLALTWQGMFYDFNPDDTTNMYLGWIKSYSLLTYTSFIAVWSNEMRPLGTLFYKVLHEIFGFDSFPFRVACFVLMIINLRLQYSLFLKLARSVGIATVALLLGAFNGAFWSIYASTGTVFDILCELFMLLALLCYMEIVRSSGRKRILLTVLGCSLTIMAFQSKEMGLALPVLAFAYEVCYLAPSEVSAGRSLRDVITGMIFRLLPWSLLGAVAVWGMFAGRHVIFAEYGYTPHFNLETYMSTSAAHLSMLSFRTWEASGPGAMLLLGGTLLLAGILKSRLAVFGWLFYVSAMIPISFVPARQDGYVLYIPYIGCALFLAGLAERLSDGLARLRLAGLSSLHAELVVITILGIVAIGIQVKEKGRCAEARFGPGGQSLVRELADTANLPGSAGAMRVVVVDGAWGDERWQPMFTIQLSRGSRGIEVIRTTSQELRTKTAPTLHPGDQVLRYSDHVYRELGEAELRELGFRGTGS